MSPRARLNYDVVLFDVDDTLLDFAKAEVFALEETLESFGIDRPLKTLLPVFQEINRAVWREYEAGTATSAEIRVKRFVQLLERLGHAANPEEVSDYYVQSLARSSFVIPGARELLTALHGIVPMGLITNGIGGVQRSRLARAGLTDFFEVIIISEEIGIQKPDPAAFAIAIEGIGSTADDRIIMVGDGLGSDIKGAVAAGIDSCWVNLRRRSADQSVEPTFTISRIADLRPILGLQAKRRPPKGGPSSQRPD